MPRMPLVAMPPSAPIRITGIGASTPRPSIIGFRTLSAEAGDDEQHAVGDGRGRGVVAARPDPADRRQRHEQRRQLRDAEHEDDHRQHPANGTPAIISETPMNSAWMQAMPMTPEATARTVAVDSWVNSLPRASPATRSKIACMAWRPIRRKPS
jgi:hypothetical protein